MRGKVVLAHDFRKTAGITPAYAGKSAFIDGMSCEKQDHPRLCGEKFSRVSPSARTSGSPPPMRGKVPQFYFSQIVYRITPAYAGKRFV